jgi:hypothetical protein
MCCANQLQLLASRHNGAGLQHFNHLSPCMHIYDCQQPPKGCWLHHQPPNTCMIQASNQRHTQELNLFIKCQLLLLLLLLLPPPPEQAVSCHLSAHS